MNRLAIAMALVVLVARLGGAQTDTFDTAAPGVVPEGWNRLRTA
jgi:hypothetical protein